MENNSESHIAAVDSLIHGLGQQIDGKPVDVVLAALAMLMYTAIDHAHKCGISMNAVEALLETVAEAVQAQMEEEDNATTH